MSRPARQPALIPADMWGQPHLAGVLTARDIGAIFRMLQAEFRLSQRQIGELVGMGQNEVHEILAGRRVRAVDVLERICDRLGCERWRMHLAALPAPAEPAPRRRPMDPPPRPVVEWWTPDLIRQLRLALRMPVRRFADHLGVSERSVPLWERGGQPTPRTQALLDDVLANAPDDAVARFARWSTSGWAVHTVLPGRVDFAAAIDAAVKVAVVAGLDLAQVTVSPVAAQAHRYPVVCGKPTGAGWCSQPRGHGGDCDG